MSSIHPEIVARFKAALSTALDEAQAIADPLRVSYPLGTIAEAAAHFAAKEDFGFTYGRTGTPVGAALERCLAAIEGGTSAIAVASGQAANYLTFRALLPRAGDEIVASTRVFGGTSALLRNELPNIGRNAVFADPADSASFENAITEKTRAIFVETVSNPDGTVADIERLAQIADKHNIPLVVDNTLAPLLARPIDWGADIVTTSLTKFFNGKGDVVAGAIIDSGKFSWGDDPRWPAITAERPNGVPSLSKVYNDKAYAAAIRQNLTLFGPSLNPADIIQVLKNAGDLAERLNRHSANALQVANLLQNHPQIEWVHYLGLESHPSHDLARKYLSAPPALLLVKPKGGLAATDALVRSFGAIRHEANIGYEGSLAIHSFDTTHRLFTPEQKQAARIEEGALRLSIGTEHPDIILGDLTAALAHIANVRQAPAPA